MMFIGRLVLWISLIVVGLVARAQSQEADCISRQEMQEIAQHFSQFSSLASQEYCFDGSQTSALLKAIVFMRQTKFQNPMVPSQDELYRGDFGASWWNYFVGRIRELNVQSSCPKRVGAFVYGFGGKTMFVCPLLLSDEFSPLDRASVFMHEARHIDGYPHVTCGRGPRAGLQGACDQRISDRGSYAVSVETYAQLGRYAVDLHPALKAYAASLAAIYAVETFNQPARVDEVQGLLLMTADRRFYHLPEGKSLDLTQMGESPLLGKIVKRAQLTMLLPHDTNERARFVFVRDEGEVDQDGGEWLREYNQLSPAERANVVDLHVAAQWAALVKKTEVKIGCDPRSDATRVLSYNGEVGEGLIFPDGYDRAAGSVMLQTQSGRVLEIGCSSNRPFIRPSKAVADQAFSRMYKIKSSTFGLGDDGLVYSLRAGKSAPLALPLQTPVYEIAPFSVLKFFE